MKACVARIAWLSTLALLFTTAPAWCSEPAALPGVANVRFPAPHRISAGALDAQGVESLHRAGVRHVITLRTPAETPHFDEAAAVEANGMTFDAIPISGPESLTLENARRLDELLNRYGEEPTVVHCGSGNRVGALIALREAWLRGASADHALAEGRRWGLTKMEDAVRAQLAQPPAPAH